MIIVMLLQSWSLVALTIIDNTICIDDVLKTGSNNRDGINPASDVVEGKPIEAMIIGDLVVELVTTIVLTVCFEYIQTDNFCCKGNYVRQSIPLKQFGEWAGRECSSLLSCRTLWVHWVRLPDSPPILSS